MHHCVSQWTVPGAPSAREWTLVVRGEPSHESTWHWEVLGSKATEYHDDTHVIEHAAYERLERELADAVEMFKRVNESAHAREVIALEERTQARAELAEAKQLTLSRERWIARLDEELTKSREELCNALFREKERNAGLVEALREIGNAAKAQGFMFAHEWAHEALAKYGREL